MKTMVVLNPNAGGGMAGRQRHRIADEIRGIFAQVDLVETAGPMDAARLAREGWDGGCRRFIAVGGDGTLNEVVNGLPVAEAPGQATVGVVTAGTGGDFRRTLGIDAGIEASLARLRSGAPRPLDVGRVRYVANDGGEGARLFVNIASFGLSGLTDARVNRARAMKRAGGRLTFLVATLGAFVRYRFQTVRLTVDGHTRTARIATVAVANGRYFGGGMMFAPGADPADGLFDVVISEGRGKLAMLAGIPKLYRGGHVRSPGVTTLRGRVVVAEPAEDEGPVLLDIDGEDPGRLPARFDLIPGGVNVWS